MARTVSQRQHKTSTLFSSPSPAVVVTFVAVVTQIVVACMGASKVMTDERVCIPESHSRFPMRRAVPKLRTPRPVTTQASEGGHLARQGI